MKRLLLVITIAASSLLADTVYFTPNGKTYHTTEKCVTLARSKVKLHAEQAEAERHGIKACGICNRAKTEAKHAKNSWASAPAGSR